MAAASEGENAMNMKKRRKADNANQWADAAKNDLQYGHDAEEQGDAWSVSEGVELEELAALGAVGKEG